MPVSGASRKVRAPAGVPAPRRRHEGPRRHRPNAQPKFRPVQHGRASRDSAPPLFTPDAITRRRRARSTPDCRNVTISPVWPETHGPTPRWRLVEGADGANLLFRIMFIRTYRFKPRPVPGLACGRHDLGNVSSSDGFVTHGCVNGSRDRVTDTMTTIAVAIHQNRQQGK